MNNTRSFSDGFPERAELGFDEQASRAFAFLEGMGFQKISVSPTIARFERGDLAANVFHGRQSYELGFEIEREGKRYSLSELIRLSDPQEADLYRNYAATTPAAVVTGLMQLKQLVARYAAGPLQGEPPTFLALDRQRRELAEKLALDSEVSAFKPKADEAFRLGRYGEAAELYDRIRAGLTPVEAKKADLARKRASSSS